MPSGMQDFDVGCGHYAVPAETCSEPTVATGWISDVNVGVQNWLSWGQSDTNFRIGPVDVASDLQWRHLVSEAGELDASAVFFHRLVVAGSVGGGVISSGNLIDSDFAFPDRQGLYSQSFLPQLTDNLLYFNGDLGWRFYADEGFTIDGLIGYQYWHERYQTNGGTQVVGFPDLGIPPPGFVFPLGPGVREEYTWQALRLGAQSSLLLCPRWTFNCRAVLLPVTQFENDDVHFLREPLLFAKEKATGGFGVMADVGFAYRIWRGLWVDAAYRIWDASSGSGVIEERFSDGSGANLPFNGANTLRQGLLLGLNYRF